MRKILILSFLFFIKSISFAQDFVTRWDLSKSPASLSAISFIVGSSGGSINYTWQQVGGPASGSGTIPYPGVITTIYNLPSGGIIDFAISSSNLKKFETYISSSKSLIDVRQWGLAGWTSMSNMFSGSINLNISAIDTPNLTSVANFSNMFSSCISLNGPANIGSWNMASAQNLSGMFSGTSSFNQDISSWNTSSVTNMSGMFSSSNFNQDISSWNTSAVTDMSYMFSWASAFNQNIGSWNTSSVTNMSGMFYGPTTSFNQNIGLWNTSAVINMSNMFARNSIFNQNINNWNTSSVINMSNMFAENSIFNQDISNWNTASVTNMSNMFKSATSFNRNISSWNTSSVTNMSSMFERANSFNQPIGSWNTVAVINMSKMFYNNTAFNENIGNWNTSEVIDMSSMFQFASIFNQNIGTWNTGKVLNMSLMFEQAPNFNQNLGAWNTSAVTNMSYMFSSASSFNQNIGSWNIANVTNMDGMLRFSGLDIDNYDAVLFGWYSGNYLNKNLGNVLFLKYCSSTEERLALTTPIASGGRGWIISQDANCTGPEINLKGNGVKIFNGDNSPSLTDHTDFGSVNIIGTSVVRIFTIQNFGSSNLILNGSPTVSISGTNASDFYVYQSPSPVIGGRGATSFHINFNPSAIGLRTATISILNVDSNENPYTFVIQGTGVELASEINVVGNNNSISNGDTFPSFFDNTNFGSGIIFFSIIKTFYIENIGNGTLTLSGSPIVSISGINSSDFYLSTPPANSVAPNASTSFQISFIPQAGGIRSATISIANNDLDENPYTFAIQGTGIPCQTSLTLQSTADDYSTGTITKEANATTGVIIATNKITNTANVTYRAGKSIQLDPGFKADNGTIFKTEFGGCN